MGDNSSYEGKLALLDKIVSDGILRLLTEARQKEHLEEPFGRAPAPTPLITEEEFVKAGGLAGALPDEPEFTFDFGFNPLEYLSKFITWSHPNSVKTREQDKQDAVVALTNRAKHANLQLDTSSALKEVVLQLRSGIFWGPIVSPIPHKEVDADSILNQKKDENGAEASPSCGVAVMCKAFKLGFVTIQISETTQFDVIHKSICQPVKVRQSAASIPGGDLTTVNESDHSPHTEHETNSIAPLEDIKPTKAQFADLKFGTQYFLRCRLTEVDTTPSADPEEEEDDLLDGMDEESAPETEYFQNSSFWTLPSDELSATPEHNTNLLEHSFSAMSLQPSVSSASLMRDDSRVDVTNTHATLDISCAPLSLLCFGQLTQSHKKNNKTYVENTDKIVLFDPLSSGEDSEVVPFYTCMLGDLMYAAPGGATNNNANNSLIKSSQSDVRVSSLFSQTPLFAHALTSVMRNTCILYSHRDSSDGSRRFLNSEEVVHRQFRHDMRRYVKKYNINPTGKDTPKDRRKSSSATQAAVATANGKEASQVAVPIVPPPPSLKRLPLSDSMQTLFELFPVDFTESYDPPAAPTGPSKPGPKKPPLTKQQQEKEAAAAAALLLAIPKGARMLYRTYMLGPDIQVIVLDMRGSAEEGGATYLGKEQSEWLKRILMDSMALWKIVLCGYSFGLVGVSNVDAVWAQEPPRTPKDRRLSGSVLRHSLPVVPDANKLLTGATQAGGDHALSLDMSIVPGPPASAETDSPGTLSKARSAKQFTLAFTEEPEKPLIDEDLEEIYLRSKHSLAYILAAVQNDKYNTAALQHLTKPTTPATQPGSARSGSRSANGSGAASPSAGMSKQPSFQQNLPPVDEASPWADGGGEDTDFNNQLPDFPCLPEVSLSSGIVVLSSGVARVVRPGTALKAPHHGDITRETATPAFITAYRTLHGVADGDHRMLSSSSSSSSSVNEASLAMRDDKELPYCAEIGLGSYNKNNTGLASRGDGQGVAQMRFGFMAGFEPRTLFTSLQQQETSAANSTATACQLFLNLDGALDVRVIETSLTPAKNSVADTESRVSLPGRVVYECKLRSHLMGVDEASEVSLTHA